MSRRAVWLDRDLIHGPYFALFLSELAFRRCMRRLGHEGEPFLGSELSDASTHLFRFEGKLCAVVTMNPERVLEATPAEVAGLLIHEAVHVWQAFCREIRESAPCDEFEAYSIQAIAQRLLVSFYGQINSGDVPASPALTAAAHHSANTKKKRGAKRKR